MKRGSGRSEERGGGCGKRQGSISNTSPASVAVAASPPRGSEWVALYGLHYIPYIPPRGGLAKPATDRNTIANQIRQITMQSHIAAQMQSICNSTRTSQRKCNQYATAHCNFGTLQRNLSANSNSNRKSRTLCSTPSRKAGHVKSLLCPRVPGLLVQAKTSSLPLAVRGFLQPLGLRGYGKECKETSPQCNKVQIFATMMATCSNSISTR